MCIKVVKKLFYLLVFKKYSHASFYFYYSNPYRFRCSGTSSVTICILDCTPQSSYNAAALFCIESTERHLHLLFMLIRQFHIVCALVFIEENRTRYYSRWLFIIFRANTMNYHRWSFEFSL